MSKTKSSFISSLARSNAASSPDARQPESPVAADEPVADPAPTRAAAWTEGPAAAPEAPEPAPIADPGPGFSQQSQLQGGRPSSLKPGERALRRNYQMTELDDQALKLYLDTSSTERDLSEVVRNALRAYIPPEIYKTAEVMLNFKRSAIGK